MLSGKGREEILFFIAFFVAGSEGFGEWSSSLNRYEDVLLLTEDLKKKTGDTCGKIDFLAKI